MITISPYVPEDLAGIRTLVAELQNYVFELEPEIFESGEVAPNYTDYLIKEAKTNKGELYVAKKENNTIVGLIAVHAEHDQDKKIESLYISDIIVTEKERAQGIGKKLIGSAEEHAKKHGIFHLRLNIIKKLDRAHKLYSDLGFRDYSTVMYKKLV